MDFGYLSILEGTAHIEYNVLWRVFLLAFLRLAPIVTLAPFLGAKIIPASARVALALTLTLVFFPAILFHMTSPYMSDSLFVGLAIKELIIGFFLGYLISVPFFMAQSAGILIDFMRGSSMLMAQDPTVQIQSSSLGIIFNQYLIVVFYAIDGPLLFFEAIQNAFIVFPVDAFIHPSFFQLENPFWQTIVGILHQVFTLSIQLAAPCIVAILMAELFLGIANRLAPQVQIAFLGMSLKSLLGLTLLWAGWYFILKQASSFSLDWVNLINKLIQDISLAK